MEGKVEFMRNCPFCLESIQDQAVKCKHCGEWVSLPGLRIHNIKFGDKLKMLRQQRDLTLEALSKLSGVQLATLSRMENNKAVGNLKSYIGIAAAMGFSLSQLFAVMERESNDIKTKTKLMKIECGN